MIELYISPKINSHKQLKRRVEDNNIALSMINSENIIEPKLIEGDKVYYGFTAINFYLDEFESIMLKWQAINCDHFYFDNNF